MNKKFIISLLCIGVVSCLLVGCGSQSTSLETGMPQEAAADVAYSASAFPDQEINDDQIAEMPYTEGETYSSIKENDFINTEDETISTFSIDVDTASYSNIRRYIENGSLPPEDAIRIEEMINYFEYDYVAPTQDVPFSVTQEMMSCPWNDEHQLLLVGLQGKELSPQEILPSNLVFLIDVSGSMNDSNKLPLLKQSFSILTSNLRGSDRVSMVVYAGAAGVILDGAEGNDEEQINEALDALYAGGSTAGAEGIELAYELAEKYYMPEGNNRVILATDGDFNVGPSSTGELEKLITNKSKKGIYLTTLGFGMGNYRDDMMETLADKGNGNYAYIDRLDEAKKVLGKQLYGTLFTIAKDTKIQVEFNEQKVGSYRLIGYENRLLNEEDFEDDNVDAGEIGAGHSVTALYEIVPIDQPSQVMRDKRYKDTDMLKGEEYGLVKLRYKQPDADTSQLMTCLFTPQKGEVSSNIGFASCVAEYGMLLRDSQYKGEASYNAIINRAKGYSGTDEYKEGFIDLVKQTQRIEE